MRLTYTHYMDSFKTGDLLLYGGLGLNASLTRLVTSSPFSGVGLVLRLPNKYTRQDELYVAEFGRNIDGQADSFSERRGEWGMNVYRLFERLHGFWGASVWYAPLLAPLERAKYEAAIQWLQDLYAFYKGFNTPGKEAQRDLAEAQRKNDARLFQPFLGHPAAPLLDSLVGDRGKAPSEHVDLASAAFVAEFLRRAGLVRGDEWPDHQRMATPRSLLSLRCYGPPAIVGVRERYWSPRMLPEHLKMTLTGLLASESVATPGRDFTEQRLGLVAQTMAAMGATEADLFQIMRVGGIFMRYEKGKLTPVKVDMRLEQDEITIAVGSTRVQVVDVTEVRKGQKTGTFDKVRAESPDPWQEALCFSIMYGIRGKSGTKLDSNSLDIACRTRLELDTWLKGLKVPPHPTPLPSHASVAP